MFFMVSGIPLDGDVEGVGVGVTEGDGVAEGFAEGVGEGVAEGCGVGLPPSFIFIMELPFETERV